MAKPSTLPEWDTTQVNSIAPDATHKDQGWLAPGGVPEKPPFQTFNYWQNQVYRWMKYLDEATTPTASIADLKAISYIPDDGQIFSVVGYYTSTENKPWFFKWVAASTETDDGGEYIELDSVPATGRFHRLFNYEDASPDMWGCKVDITTDDTVAFNKYLTAQAITTGYGGAKLNVGEMHLNSEISPLVNISGGWRSLCYITGQGAGIGTIFNLANADQRTFENIVFRRCSIAIAVTQSTTTNTHYKNLEFSLCDIAIDVGGSWNNFIVDCMALAMNPGGTCFKWSGNYNYNSKIVRTVVGGNSTTRDTVGIDFSGGSLLIESCDIESNLHAIKTSGNDVVNIKNCHFEGDDYIFFDASVVEEMNGCSITLRQGFTDGTCEIKSMKNTLIVTPVDIIPLKGVYIDYIDHATQFVASGSRLITKTTPVDNYQSVAQTENTNRNLTGASGATPPTGYAATGSPSFSYPTDTTFVFDNAPLAVLAGGSASGIRFDKYGSESFWVVFNAKLEAGSTVTIATDVRNYAGANIGGFSHTIDQVDLMDPTGVNEICAKYELTDVSAFKTFVSITISTGHTLSIQNLKIMRDYHRGYIAP